MLPVGITTCQVSFGKALGYMGSEATLTGSLTADRSIVHTASGYTIMPANEPVTQTAGGELIFDVPHVDQAGFTTTTGNTITNWAYILTGKVRFAGGPTIPFKRSFQVFVGQDSIDLDLVPDGPIIAAVSAPSRYALIDDATGDVLDGNGQPVTGGSVDLSGYATQADLSTGLASKVNSSTYTSGLAAKADLSGGVVPDGELPTRLSDASLSATYAPHQTGALTAAGTTGNWSFA